MTPNPWLILGGIGIALGLIIGSYLKGRGDGAESVRAEMRVLVDARNAEVEKLEQAADKVSEDTGHDIEDQRQARAAEGDRARAAVLPVRLCADSNRRELPETASPAVSTHSTGPGEGLPVRAGDPDRPASPVPDIGPGLIALMESCQRDRDSFVQWQNWYREQAVLSR